MICNNSHAYDGIVKYLDTHPLMKHILVVPFFCTLFGIVAKENLSKEDKIGIESHTQLMIYGILHLLTRRLESDTNGLAASRETQLLEWDISEEHQVDIIKHTSLAAKGFINSNKKLKLMFSSSDIEEEGIGTADKVGLLEYTRERTTVKQAREYYYFMHLTIQEFLAAVHVCLTWKEEDVTLLSKVDPESRTLDNIQLFIAGLLGDKDMGHGFLRSLSQGKLYTDNRHKFITNLCSHDTDNKLAKLQIMRCAHEGNMSDMMVHIKETVLTIEGSNTRETLGMGFVSGGLLPHHLTSIGWFIQQCQCVTKLM